jgi:hypothetical protein
VWFLDPKRKMRDVALSIVHGLRNGTIVPDPPLGHDPGEALTPAEPAETGLVPLPATNLNQGVFLSYLPAPMNSLPGIKWKRSTRATYRETGLVVVAGGSQQEVVRNTIIQ